MVAIYPWITATVMIEEVRFNPAAKKSAVELTI